MLNRRLFYIVTLLVMVLSLGGCKSRQGGKAVKNSLSISIDYETFSVPKLSFAAGGAFSVNGSLRIRRDSAIMISVQPFLGMEVARAFITQDSLIVVDRMHKRYFKTSYGELGKKTGVMLNYNVFQALFTEALFAYDNPQSKFSDFTETKVGDLTMLQYAKDGVVQEFVVNNEYRVQQATVISEKTTFSLHWNYSKFNALENGIVFPHQIKFQISDGKRPNNLDIEYKKVELDKTLVFDAGISGSYQEVTVEELLSSIGK